MIKTLSLDDLEKYAENIYEAIIVLAKRARQINDEQKQVLMQDMDFDDEFDEYEEEEVEQIVRDSKHEALPKPTTLALEEFLSGKIKFDYHVPSDEQEQPA